MKLTDTQAAVLTAAAARTDSARNLTLTYPTWVLSPSTPRGARIFSIP